MDKKELHTKIMQDICIPQYFSDYKDSPLLLTILEEADNDEEPFQHLSDEDNPAWDVWEPFENYTASELYNSMDTLAESIIDFLIENDMASVIPLRRTVLTLKQDTSMLNLQYVVHPCRNVGECNIEKCSTEQAEFWAVYYLDSEGHEHWRDDFDTLDEAVHFMESLA